MAKPRPGLPPGFERISGRRESPSARYDVLIAATALAQGATLVTRNLREFRRVKGLRVEDWY